MPEISIITPFYNSEKYIEKCISSVINQSFSDFELILVDDGSIDNSEKIVKNTQFIRLRNIAKESYEIYELEKRILRIKLFMKHYF